MKFRNLLLIVAVLAAMLAWAVTAPAQEARKPVTIEGKNVLPLRVLVRPFSNVYTAPDEAQGTVRENVAAFTSFYVYTRPTQAEIDGQTGWYEVGTDNRGAVLGWMKAKDVFEWKQTMCLAYNHPENREPVLMFDGKDALSGLVAAPAAQRTQQAQGYYQAIQSGNIPAGFPVVSVEPNKYIDMAEQFYLLPILDFEPIELDGREGRMVQLAAVTKAGPDAREETDIRENQEYLAEASASSTAISAQDIKDLKIDIVWVADTTVSMRPYIQQTLQVVRDVSEQITLDTAVSKGMQFGIWGYRDPVEQIQGIGYTTKNYTPQLQPIAQFMQTLAGVDVTEIDSVDYAEDVFSGMADAIQNTAWRPGAIRFLILIGDAPGHKLGEKFNVSGQDEITLRSFANDQSAYIYAVHIKNPKAKQRYHDEAEAQFKALATNKGTNQAAYWSVFSNDMDGFASISSMVAGEITKAMQGATQGVVAVAPAGGGEMAGLTGGAVAPDNAGASAPAQPATGGEMAALQPTAADQAMVQSVIRAALVEWIGQKTGAQAPRDIVAWAVDKDLVNPATQSMDVKLLINKRQLDSMKTVLEEVMEAGLRGQISGEDFFAALQATAATASRDPEQIKKAKRLADTGLVPEFLDGLPYKSRIMDMSSELWASWSIDEQDEFLNQLDARMKMYQAIHDDPDGWIELNKGDDPGDFVYPISLELLP